VLKRPRLQPFAQLLLTVSSLMIVVGLLLVDVARVDVWVLIGTGIIVLNAVIMLLVWRAKPTKQTGWLAVIPLVDIVACVPIRDAAFDVIPTAGLLVIFPVGWLAFAFQPAVTVAGVVLTSLLPLTALLRSTGSGTIADWMALGALPIVMGLIAVTIRIIARDLRAAQSHADRVTTRLTDVLRSSGRDGAVLQALLDATDDAVAVFDIDGHPVLLNAMAAEITDRAGVDTLMQRDPLRAVFAADGVTPMRIGPDFVEAVRAGEFAAPRVIQFGVDPRRLMQLIVRPVMTGGEAIGIVAVAQDVTDLVHAVEVRDQFLSSVGHEFRTPLTVILGHTDIALMNDGVDRERWQTVERSAERLLRLVERLIAAGQSSLDRGEARSGVAHVGAVVKHAVREVTSRAADRGIPIVVEPMPDLSARIAVRDLFSVVEELVRNAVEFTPAGGPAVVVSAASDGADAVISVTDRGVGMNASERRLAFDRFYRTEYARVHAIPGTGIGLSIAASLAEAYGGSVALEGGEHGGTRALIRVPAT
jgi:two-component system, OmpR family, phosphate regulon sensor histidine kinase PhoR